MNINTQTVQIPRFTAAVPRGARFIGWLADRLAALRAVPPLLEKTAAQEAAAVRELALRVQRTDPGYASDLFAAADRHEAKAAGLIG